MTTERNLMKELAEFVDDPDGAHWYMSLNDAEREALQHNMRNAMQAFTQAIADIISQTYERIAQFCEAYNQSGIPDAFQQYIDEMSIGE